MKSFALAPSCERSTFCQIFQHMPERNEYFLIVYYSKVCMCHQHSSPPHNHIPTQPPASLGGFSICGDVTTPYTHTRALRIPTSVEIECMHGVVAPHVVVNSLPCLTVSLLGMLGSPLVPPARSW